MFTPELVDAVGGSGSLTLRRRAAAQRALTNGKPSFTAEEWRYTPIDDLDIGRFGLVTAGGAAPPEGLLAGFDADASAVVRVINGVVRDVAVYSDDVSVCTLGNGADASLGGVCVPSSGPAPDAFAEWNLALCSAPVVVRIAPNATLRRPIVIRSHTDAADGVWFPRLVVRAERSSTASVVEHCTSTDAASLVCPVTELSVDDSASLAHVTVQELGAETWQIAHQVCDVQRDARLRVAHVAVGGQYARVRIDTVMSGAGGHGEIDAVYFGHGSTTLDFRTFQHHVAPRTTSDLLFKGAVDDEARAVYTGLIRIGPDAAHVTAEQTNRNLKLSDRAWAESVPNLEIENNDVQCSHASSIGPVDADQRFYLESRGVPTEVAESLVVRGFFDEVLDRLPVPAVAARVRGRIDDLVSAS